MALSMAGVEEILHTLTPQDGDDYLSMQFSQKSHHGLSGSPLGNEVDVEVPARERHEMEMDDDSSNTGASADSPLAREGVSEEERGRSREWTRVADGMEDSPAIPPSSATAASRNGGGEKVAIKEEESPMMV